MRLCKAVVCWCLLALFPFTVSALGLGNISLDSALNEPFSAEVPIESVGNTDLDQLEVTLASNDTFERYGLDRPLFLNGFAFDIDNDDAGLPVIRVSSAQPISEPFVTFLLDVKWASGRLLREYTVLLDPPVYDSQSVQTEVAPAETRAEPADVEPVTETVIVADEATAEVAGGEVLTPLPLDAGMDEPAETRATEPAPVVIAKPEPVAEPEPVVAAAPQVQATSAGDYQAAKGDTLWSIAERTRGTSGLTNNQMMMAIYRANPEAFLGNINALKAGAILRIPDAAEADTIDAVEATAEAREQYAAWSGAATAAAAPSAAEETGQLELVVPGSDDLGDGVGSTTDAADGQRVNQLEADLIESQRLLQVRDAELRALQERVNELEQSAADVETATEAEVEAGDDLAAIAEDGEAAAVADEEILVEGIEEPLDSPFADDAVEELTDDSVPAEPAAVETAPVAEPEVADVSEADEGGSSFISELLGSYWLWGAAGLVLILALFLARRRSSAEDADATGTWADVAGEGADEGDGTVKDFSELPSFEDSIVVDEVDDELAEDAAGPAEIQEPEAEPEAEPIFDAESEQSLEDAASDEVDFDLGDTDVSQDVEPTASLEQLDAADAAAGPDDEVETPLEKTISTGAPLNLDQADPVAEAEFHMAYGLYDQAADLLVHALNEEPDSRSYRVKLIEVYFVWENKEGFLEQAAILRESISDDSDSDWNKVLILGKQLCPDSELFAGADASAPAADSMDLALSDDVGETDIDFSLGGTEVEALDESALDAGGGGLDFDLGAADSASDDASADAEEVVADLDFDLGGDSDDDDGLALDLGGDAEEDGDNVSLDLTGAADDDFDHAETTRLDVDDLAETMESPTVEALGSDAPTVATDMGGETMESPTLDMDVAGFGADNDTLESTMESPTLDVPGSTSETAEMPALGEASLDEDGLDEDGLDNDPTSLDVDLSGLADLPLDELGDDLGVDAEPAAADDSVTASEAGSTPDIDSTLNQLDNTGELLTMEDMGRTIAGESVDESADDESEASKAPDIDSTLNQLDNTGELLTMEDMGKTIADDDATMMAPVGSLPDSGLDFDLGDDESPSDTVEQPVLEDPAEGDTAEQPEISADTLTDLDAAVPEDATMTEVGTKLDLARAYIDMGDPDGARSILSEVLDEGGDSQQQEARQLLEELGD